MDKKLFRSLIFLITYAIVLVVLIVRLDAVTGWVDGILHALKPLFIGFALAFILNGPCRFFSGLYGGIFDRKGQKFVRPLAVISSYIFFFALIAILLSLVIPELVHSIQTFVGNLSVYTANLQQWYDFIVDTFHLVSLAELELSALINDTLNKLLSGALDLLTNTVPQLISVTGAVISAVVTTVLSLVFSAYMLASGPTLTRQCRTLVTTYLPERWAAATLSVGRLTADTFSRYISGQVLEACILGGLCFIGMCIFRFDYAPLISVIIGVSALIPIAGAYMGAAIAALLLVMIEPMQALLFLIFLVVLQQLEGNLIYPRVVGSSLGLPGLWVLAAVTVGSSLMGFTGLIVAVPITAILYTLLKRDVKKRQETAS